MMTIISAKIGGSIWKTLSKRISIYCR